MGGEWLAYLREMENEMSPFVLAILSASASFVMLVILWRALITPSHGELRKSFDSNVASVGKSALPVGSWGLFFVRTLIVLIVIIMMISGVAYYIITATLHAEERLHATLFTIRLVEQFVEVQGRWPSSWDELEAVTLLSAPPAPLHGQITVLRIGGQHGYDWPTASPIIQQLVWIDFRADPVIIARQHPMVFTAIRPLGSSYEYRSYGFVDSLQRTIRKSVEDKAEKGQGGKGGKAERGAKGDTDIYAAGPGGVYSSSAYGFFGRPRSRSV